MHHVVNTVSAGPGITFKKGREEHVDTSVLDTEMENRGAFHCGDPVHLARKSEKKSRNP